MQYLIAENMTIESIEIGMLSLFAAFVTWFLKWHYKDHRDIKEFYDTHKGLKLNEIGSKLQKIDGELDSKITILEVKTRAEIREVVQEIKNTNTALRQEMKHLNGNMNSKQIGILTMLEDIQKQLKDK